MLTILCSSEFTCKKNATEFNGVADASRTKNEVPPILHGNKFITKVGVSYMDDKNDDVPKVDSISHGCYQALSSSFMRRDPGNKASWLSEKSNCTYENLTLHM